MTRVRRNDVVSTGIDPGFINDVIPVLLSGLCERVDEIRAFELFNYSSYAQEDAVRNLVGMGQPMDATPPMLIPGVPTMVWGGPIRLMARGLGLEKAGVALDSTGGVRVDAYSKSNVDSIYAVGDVTNRVALTPVAIREGHAFADTVFGGKPTTVDHKDIPTAVFTTPELGTVGLGEAEAREAYDIVDIYSASFRPLKATLSGRQDKTIMKIVVDGASDRVLGVHILGDDAGEMAQILGIAVKLGATKADFDATMALHPTSAEELVTMRTRTARYERAPE